MVATERLQFDKAQRHADDAVAVAPAGQLGFTLGWSAIYAALRALLAGELDRAEALYGSVAERMVAAGEANGAVAGLIGKLAVRHAAHSHGTLAEELLAVSPFLGDTFQDIVAQVLVAAGRNADAAAVWRADVLPARTYYWQLWMVARSEVAIGLGHRGVAEYCYAQLTPWAGMLAGVSSGSITLGPVDQTLADLAAFLGRPDAERAAHLRGALTLSRAIGQPQWTRRAEAALHDA
jgi:hypothetical protein